MAIIIAGLIVFTVFSLSVSAAQTKLLRSQPVHISGGVRNLQGEYLSGVTVIAHSVDYQWDFLTTTNEYGYFNVHTWYPGDYVLIFYLEGYHTKTISIEDTHLGDEISLNIYLLPILLND